MAHGTRRRGVALPECIDDLEQPVSRRAATSPVKRYKREHQRVGALLYPEHFKRPSTRADCIDAPRPCPYVGCRHHLYLDVGHRGSIKFNFPDLEPWELTWTCALDIADAGERPAFETVGRLLNITRARAQQIEFDARCNVARANARLAVFLEP